MAGKTERVTACLIINEKNQRLGKSAEIGSSKEVEEEISMRAVTILYLVPNQFTC